MLRRRPQLLSIAALLLIVAVAAVLFLQDSADSPATATPPPGTAVAAGATNPTATTANLAPVAPQATATAQRTTAAQAGGNQATATRANATATAARPQPTATRTATPQAAPPRTPTPESTLPTITLARLPREAQETIRLIDVGGPFPYDRDGITFGNRERLLPLKPDGYYREYTVITPGSSDRGARRIVGGREGELYYTDDHYESFRRVIR